MDFNEMNGVAKEVREAYQEYETEKYGEPWGVMQLMTGLITDLGDLSRLVMAMEGHRKVEGDVDEMIKHELADCMWVIMVLADMYEVDLPSALVEMRDEVMERIEKEAS